MRHQRWLMVWLFVLAISIPGGACSEFLQPRYVLPDFSVQLLDWTGKPLPEAVVRLWPSAVEPSMGEPKTSLTNGQGIADFRGAVPGAYDLTTEMPHGENIFVKVVAEMPAQPTEAKLTLNWPNLPVLAVHRAAGRLQSPDGKPFLASLALLDGKSGRELASTMSDTTGRFEFPSVNPGPYFIRASRKNELVDIAVAIDPDCPIATLDLEVGFGSCGAGYVDKQECVAPALEVSNVCGFVLDPTGAAIPEAQIDLRPSQAHAARAITTSANWKDGSFALQDVAPGRYTFSVHRPGFKRLQVPMRILDGSGRRCLKPITVTLAVFGTCSKASISDDH